MIGKILLALCFLTLDQVCSNAILSRENPIEQSPHLAFKNVLAQIRSTDIHGETVKLVLRNAEETVSGLSDLLATKSNPEVNEVLDVLNNNFGVKLLVVNDENVQVDPKGYQRFLSNQAMSLAKSVFPGDMVQRAMLYGVFEQQIQRTCKAIRPEIESRIIPVEQMTALIATNGQRVGTRDILSTIINAAQTSVCNTVVSLAFTQVNNTLTSIITFIDSVSVSSGNNIIVALISFILDYAAQVVEGVREITESFTASICSELFSSSSRKRRDVADDSGLVDFGTRDIQTRSLFSVIFDIIWGILSPILNVTAKHLWDSLIVTVELYITSFLEGSFTDWAYSLIDSVF